MKVWARMEVQRVLNRHLGRPQDARVLVIALLIPSQEGRQYLMQSSCYIINSRGRGRQFAKNLKMC